MNTLSEAWQWYESTRQQLWLFQRMARRYWDRLPWEGVLDRDDEFKAVDPERIVNEAAVGIDYLDDLAIVVLFSAFEAAVRGSILVVFDQQAALADHPVIQSSLDDTRSVLAEGSFFRVLEAYSRSIDPSLIEQVNQVRKYRNWVAHGRREGHGRPANVTPRAAYDRLTAFLLALGLS